MKSFKNLLNKKIGKWLVLSQAGFDNNSDRLWLCRCECGLEKTVKAMYLLAGSSKQCVKCGQKPRKYAEELSQATWNRILIGAKKRQIIVNITKDDAYICFLNQNRKCALTGLEIKLPSCDQDCRLKIATASLDRIDSNKSYELGNIQWLHKDINLMKNVLAQDYFVKMCKLVAKDNK